MTETNIIKRHEPGNGYGFAVSLTTVWESADKDEVDIMEKVLREKFKEKEEKA